jgi:hypothetical protein
MTQKHDPQNATGLAAARVFLMRRISSWPLASLPGQVALRRALIMAASLFMLICCYSGYSLLNKVTQTIGKDAVPSIVAAEKIRTTLAYAHTNYANAFLSKQGLNGASMQEYQKAMAEAHDSLVTAAQNITYGNEERAPILHILTNLNQYERLVGASFQNGRFDDSATAADFLMRHKILENTKALDQANFDHLNVSYTRFNQSASLWLFAGVFSAFIVLVLLIESQWKIYRGFRRKLNPPLLASTLLFALATLFYAMQFSANIEHLHIAKDDAFDSVHALSKARAVTFDANAQESIYLLHTGNAQVQALKTAEFRKDALLMWNTEMLGTTISTDTNAMKGQGLLADELANITFGGEKEAATQMLQAWLDYSKIDGQIRQLEASGQHGAATALDLGTHEGQSDWAFERFDTAIRKTIDINQAAFESAIHSSFMGLWLMLVALWIMCLAPIAGAFLGFKRRLAEFGE